MFVFNFGGSKVTLEVLELILSYLDDLKENRFYLKLLPLMLALNKFLSMQNWFLHVWFF